MIARWLSLVEHVETDLLPAGQGRLVKCLGDGMLLEFGEARAAASVAFAIQHASRAPKLRPADRAPDAAAHGNRDERRDRRGARRLWPRRQPRKPAREPRRAGRDHRLGAGPRSAHRRSSMPTPRTLGSAFLKHVQQPVRANRIGPPGPRPTCRLGFGVLTRRPAPDHRDHPVQPGRGDTTADDDVPRRRAGRGDDPRAVPLARPQRDLAPVDLRVPLASGQRGRDRHAPERRLCALGRLSSRPPARLVLDAELAEADRPTSCGPGATPIRSRAFSAASES